MWAFLTKLLPFLAPLLDKLWPSTRADELRAEAELEEARAFSRGRIAPRYLLKYVAVILLSLFGLAVLVDAIVPGLIPGTMAAMRDFSAAGADWLASVMDF